ncbi:MAG: sugar ABC transporter substrate-binding protein [Caldilinea sp.]|nr:sugar ABC transporter substrate-binding protein [Caldilinea sp.]MDW8440844.1 sugar ABC transporter substrate-binding protein [Caldilineaceae bacterium]
MRSEKVFDKVLWIVGALLTLLLLASCRPASDDAALPSIFEQQSVETLTPGMRPDKFKIALVMKTLTNPFFVEMEKGARRAQDEFDVDLVVKTGAQETSIEQQIAIVEEMIAAHVDAIVIAPGSSTELIPVLKKAQDAGVVVINIDNRLDKTLSEKMGLVGVPFVSVDNEQGAYLSAKCIADRITEPADVAILEGIREAKNAQDRKAGAERAFAENPYITLVASETAHWKIDEGYTVMRRMLEQHPSIRGVFAANDMMGLGAIAYLEESGRTDVMVAAYDALEEALEAVRAGKMLCTIDQQPAEQGYLGVRAAVQALNGASLPGEILLEVRLIHRNNVP